MKRLAARTLSLALAALALAALAGADVLLLKDGRRFEGTVKSESDEEVVFETRLGELRFPRSEISKIERGKTARQEFYERWETCAGAGELHALGLWAEERKLRSEARKAMKEARRLDPEHEGANLWLGYVRHAGRWVTPEERAELVAREEDERMAARGLVRHGERWVTPEAQEKLAAGLVLHEGRWLTLDEVRRAQGLELLDGQWMSAGRAAGIAHAREVLRLAGAAGAVRANDELLVAGPFEPAFLDEIVAGLVRGRAWFDARFQPPPGIALFGGRLAELYVWAREEGHYHASVDCLAGLTTTVPDGWAEAVKRTHGFVYWDPFPVSSARVWGRPMEDVAGHSYHHFGHALANRLLYDGRLLPPWFDESFACLFEHRVHERNAVFCLASPATVASGGRTSGRRGPVEHTFDTKVFRRGAWRETLAAALADGARLPTIDELGQRRFGELTMLDLAVGMGVLSWLEAREARALEAFHAELKRSAPRAPLRVLDRGAARQARYDRAFEQALGIGWRAADGEWKTWFLETSPESGTTRRR